MNYLEENLNLDNLIEKLSLANTPGFLYKHFRQDNSIYENSIKFSTNELIDFLKPLIHSIETTKDLVIVYSIIIALTFKQTDEVDVFFKALNNSDLRWADKISELYFLNHSIKNIDLTINASSSTAEIIESNLTFSLQQV